MDNELENQIIALNTRNLIACVDVRPTAMVPCDMTDLKFLGERWRQRVDLGTILKRPHTAS
jgi:hypothetical protein